MFLFISYLLSCTTRVINCPPKFTIYRDINKAYPIYAREPQLEIKNSLKTLKGIEDTASISLKSSVVKLREDLDQTSSRLEMLIKSNLQSYYAGICDAAIRKSFVDFQTKMADLTIKLAEIDSTLEINRGNKSTQSKVEEAQQKLSDVNNLMK